VVEGITEVLRSFVLILLRSLRGLLLMLLMLRTGTTVAMTVTTVTAITTLATVATLTTLGALTALTTGRTLHIVGGLLNQHTMRELVLTSLRIDLEELHLDMVALLDASLLDGLEALPVDLGDMEQTVLAGHDLHEAAVRHD
jgi:hypothetical protein